MGCQGWDVSFEPFREPSPTTFSKAFLEALVLRAPKITIANPRSTVSEKRTHWASLSFGANSVSSAKNSVSSRLHTKNRMKGTHWVRPPGTQWAPRNSQSSVFETVLPETVFGPFRVFCRKRPRRQPNSVETLFSSKNRKNNRNRLRLVVARKIARLFCCGVQKIAAIFHLRQKNRSHNRRKIATLRALSSSLTLQSLLFFDFLAFFFLLLSVRIFHAFLRIFGVPFRGSAKRSTLAFFGVSLVFSPPKKQGFEG